MQTDIDVIFDALLLALDPLDEPRPTGTPIRVPRFPLALLLEADMRRRARFIDSGMHGPHERWPYATPSHLVDEFAELAGLLTKQTDIKHSAALERVARVAGYRNWAHMQAERQLFEEGSGEAFRNGLVIATYSRLGPDIDFVHDPGLLFLAARDLVHEYSATDPEGGWYQLVTPSTVGGETLQFMATRQLLLREIGANYWCADNGVAHFYRHTGEVPKDAEEAVRLARGLVSDGALKYLWFRGTMHRISPIWD